MYQGGKKASEKRRTATSGKGTNQRLGKNQKLKAESPVLPCLAMQLQELEVRLGL